MISIIIPTRNRPDDLVRAVLSVLRQTRQPDEIIIVDQSTSEEGKKRVYELVYSQNPILSTSIVYISSKQLGPSTSRNLGVKKSHGSIIQFIDDDIILDANYLEQIENTYRQYPEVIGVGGIEKQMEYEAKLKLLYYRLFFVGPYADKTLLTSKYWRGSNKPVHVQYLKGCLASFKREVFNYHSFDEAWVGALMEDKDFCFQCITLGKLYINPMARAWHNLSTKNRLVRAEAFEAGTSAWGYFYMKNIEGTIINRLLYIWLHFGLLLNAVHKSILHRSTGPIKGVFQGWRTICNNFVNSTHIDLDRKSGYGIH